jgi:hypothetical protein
MNSSKFELPTADGVAKACDEFDSDRATKLIEPALTALFGSYPDNTNPAEVLLKVVTLNILYSTRIPTSAVDRPNVFDIAERIPKLNLDKAFKDGSLEIVKVISTAEFPEKIKKINRFSFATKYASWHRQDVYPMWDSNVQRYLTCLRQLRRKDWDEFSAGFKLSSDWGYPEFHALIKRFRAKYELDAFSFKDLDKFLYLRGAALKAEHGDTDLAHCPPPEGN